MNLAPDQEILTAALGGRKMPAEKVVAWLLRILIALLVAALLFLYQGIESRLEATTSEIQTRTLVAETTHTEIRADVVDLERRVIQVEAATPEVQRRLQRIEDKLDQLVERGH